MFLGNDVVEFINKIINSENAQNQDIKRNIEEFYRYLKLTKMADEETLKCVNKIIDCLPQIIELKKKIGYFDINTILKDEKEKMDKQDQTKAKQIIKKYEEKHYNHYYASSSTSCGTNTSSSSCGSSSRKTDRC